MPVMNIIRWVLLLLVCSTANASIPDDTLIMAFRIDDIHTLDPAETFEFSAIEVIANTYNRLLRVNPKKPNGFLPELAHKWDVSENGKTYTFHLLKKLRFASGNPITSEDVSYSLKRVIALKKSPASLLTQLGIEHTGNFITCPDAHTLVIRTPKALAPDFVLAILASHVGSVVDSNLVKSHAKSDWGNQWLRKHYAGSGPYRLVSWQPSKHIFLTRNTYSSLTKAKTKNIIIKHVKDAATQALLLQEGDVDVARNVNPNKLSDTAGIKRLSANKGWLYYLGLNLKNPHLKIPEVRQALKYLIDYDAIVKHLKPNEALVHQSFIPKGYAGAYEGTPFSFNLEKAKSLLKKVNLENGFSLNIDALDLEVATALQSSFAKANITLNILPADSKQILTKYRARQHDIFMGTWGTDYNDPHSNAAYFTTNMNNSDTTDNQTLAWRNTWDIPLLTALSDQAKQTSNPKDRAALYHTIQRIVQTDGPFIILYQKIENALTQTNIHGLILGPSSDTTLYHHVQKTPADVA